MITNQNLELLPEYHQRLSVLQTLGYVDSRTMTVQLKGRVACEINSADELLLTELVLNNFFGELDCSEIVAVLSIFLFQEKSERDEEIASLMGDLDTTSREPIVDSSTDALTPRSDRWSPKLMQALRQVRETARKIVSVQEDLGVPVKVETYLRENLHYGLVEVVYEWSRGMSFKQIMGLTEVLEGSIVRCIIRLEETCRELKDAARLVGDGSLFTKMEAAGASIKRDIVFCGSLYV
jgi:antiviral helicase SKI2